MIKEGQRAPAVRLPATPGVSPRVRVDGHAEKVLAALKTLG